MRTCWAEVSHIDLARLDHGVFPCDQLHCAMPPRGGSAAYVRLVFEQLPDGFIVHLWNKDIRRVRAGVGNTQRMVFLGIQSLLLLRGQLGAHSNFLP